MPASTNLTNDWDIDFTNRILSHKDITVEWDGRTAGNAPALGDWVRGQLSFAVGKVIGGTNLGGADATGNMILTNVKGRFEDGEEIKHLDEIPFDGVTTAKGINLGDALRADGGSEDFDVYAIEFEYGKEGVTTGQGTLYGDLIVTGFGDDEVIDNVTTGDDTVAIVNGSEVDNGDTWDGDVNGLPTTFTTSGILNYDAGTVDASNDALVLSGERSTGVLNFGGQPNNNEVVIIGTQTYTFKTTLTPSADEVLIAGSEIASMRNLVNAVNGGAGEGTDYANGTTPNTLADIAITDVAGVEATARTFIPSTTATVSTTTVTGATWADATLLTGASGSTGRGRIHTRTLTSVTATGSYIVNDVDGTWVDNDTLFIDQVLQYDTVEAGESFSVGDVVQGQTSGAQGRVIAVTGSRLILAEQTLRFEEDEAIHRVNIDQTTTDIADVTTDVTHADEISAVTINHPNSQPTPRVQQKQLLQGGLLASTLNPVRHVRQLYNFIQDTWDEFDQMDDTVPMSGQVKNAQYTLINNWFIPDRSMRFLDSGSIRDSTSDNIWANPQSLGTLEAVGALGFGANAVQPQLYIEQDSVFVDIEEVPALEGHINQLIKIKTNSDTVRHTGTDGQGAQIDSGRIRVYNRFYLHTYSHFFTANNDTGGVVTIALATSNDLNNTLATHDFQYDNGAVTYFVGEEIISDGAGTVADPIAVGVVVSADTGATGNVQYVLKSTGTNFVDPNAVTGQISQVTKDVDTTIIGVVSAYSDKIGFGHVDSNFTGGTTTGTFQIGEGVTQDTSGAIGIILEDETGATTLYIDELDALWDTNNIVGDESGASYNPSTRTADTVAPKDIGDEVDNDYTCIFGLDKTNSGSGRTIQECYEYTKYIVSKEADASFQLMGGRNQLVDVQGRLYRNVDQSDASPTFAEQVDAPYGIKAGALFLTARSVFVQDMASADIQNYNTIDDAGVTEIPPNVQSLEVTGLAVGDRVVTYETTAPASVLIKTTQYAVDTVGGADNGATDIIIKLKTATDAVPLGADTPSTGTVRVEDPNNAGLFLNFTYGSRLKSDGEFTLDTTAEQSTPEIGDITSGTDLNENDDAYVTLLSVIADTATESQTIEFVSDIDIMTRVRKRGILPFEVTGTFSSTGASIATIRTTDPVVDPV